MPGAESGASMGPQTPFDAAVRKSGVPMRAGPCFPATPFSRHKDRENPFPIPSGSRKMPIRAALSARPSRAPGGARR